MPGRAPEADRQIEDVDGVPFLAKPHRAGQPSAAVLLLGDVQIESEAVGIHRHRTRRFVHRLAEQRKECPARVHLGLGPPEV